MIVKIERVNEHAILPIRSTDGAAGFDLFNSGEKIAICPGETKFISTGIKMEIPKGYVGFIYARSGLGCRHGIVPSNCVGVIDSDYRGEIIVCLYNHGSSEYLVSYGDKIAQLIISEIPDVVLEEVESLSKTKRNDKGFGSTGK